MAMDKLTLAMIGFLALSLSANITESHSHVKKTNAGTSLKYLQKLVKTIWSDIFSLKLYPYGKNDANSRL